MNVLSLFAGIGGIDLGLESLGWDTVAFSEYDPGKRGKPPKRQYAAEVMQARFPQAASCGDIRQLTFARNREGIPGVLWEDPIGEELSRFVTLYKGGIDIIAGGFPCQDISFAGKGAGIEDGERSGLWRHFAEAIVGIRPRGVLIENVAALAGRGLDRVLHDLASAGYDAEWDIIPAAAVGAPHLRERMFVIAWSHRFGNHGEWPEPPVFDCWLEEPAGIPRLVTEQVEDRAARLRCLGNAVVPQCAAWVGHLLSERIAHETDDTIDVSQWDARHGRGDKRGQSKEIGWAGFMGNEDGFSLPQKLPRSGRMTAGWVYERKRSATRKHATETGLKYMAPTLRPRSDDHPELPHNGLVPTPNATVANDGEGAETWIERKVAHATKEENATRASMPLAAYAQVKEDPRLVPTPTAKDADSSRSRTALRDTPPARESQMGETLTDFVDPTNGGKLLPTPRAADADKGVRSPEGARDEVERLQGRGSDLDTAVKLLPVGLGGPLEPGRLLPTPIATDGEKVSTGTLARLVQFDESTAPGDVRDDRAPRDEGVVQNQPRTSAHGRLNPAWVEPLMGFPPGWTVLES